MSVSVTDIVAVVGLIVGVISLITVIYTAAWKLSAISTKVDTLWEIFLEDGRSEVRRLGLTERQSSERLTSLGQEKLSAGLRKDIDALLPKLGHKGRDRVFAVVSKVGVGTLRKVAEANEITLGQLIGLISLYLEVSDTSSRPNKG
jgi:hypothetical protein